MPQIKTKNAKLLEKGDKAPAVTGATKTILGLKTAGKCANPVCEYHLTLGASNVGQCAHIIPETVDGPREDWATPLEERNKLPNLLYLCHAHHKQIDDFPEEYPAALLRQWKQAHETFALSIRKDQKAIPDNIKKTIEGAISRLESELTQETSLSTNIVSQLLKSAKELLLRNYLDQAEIVLGQIEICLTQLSDNKLTCEFKTLKAILLWKNEKIVEAKEAFLELAYAYPDSIDPLLTYVELCDTTPSPKNKTRECLEKAKTIDANHPRLKVMALNKELLDPKKIVDVSKETIGTDDPYLKGRFYLICALFEDRAENYQSRDNFLELWQSLLPHSSKPHLWKIHFKIWNLFQKGEPALEKLKAVIEYCDNEEKIIQVKDPLTKRDLVFLYLRKLRLRAAYGVLSGSYGPILNEYKIKTLELIRGCYFDTYLDAHLLELITQVRLTKDEHLLLCNIISQSEVPPSQELSNFLFLQGLCCGAEAEVLIEFFRKHDRSDLVGLFNNISNKRTDKIMDFLKSASADFASYLLTSLHDPELVLAIAEKTTFPKEVDEYLKLHRLKSLEQLGRLNDALTIIEQLNLNELHFSSLEVIENIAGKAKRHDIFIGVANRLLKADLTPEQKAILNAKLAFAYANLDDDTNTVTHARNALTGECSLIGEQNLQSLLGIMIRAQVHVGETDNACKTIEEFSDLTRSTGLRYLEVDTYLKSNIPKKANKALLALFALFKEVPQIEDRLYSAIFAYVNQLCALGVIDTNNKLQIVEDSFVRLEGLENSWFYLGNESAYDAIVLSPSDPRYDILIGKDIGDTIDWPAARFSSSNASKRIDAILSRGAYLCARSSESMQRLASVGDRSVQAIEVLDKSGKLDLKNIKAFFEEVYRGENDFFKLYSEGVLPFAFLCQITRGIHCAIAKLSNENKGFIHCNDGTQIDINKQASIACEAIKGRPLIIDGLPALVLAETGYLNKVLDNLPNVYVTTSVIAMLRDVANAFHPSEGNAGKIGYAAGQIKLGPANPEGEETFHQKLLQAAKILDNWSNKLLGFPVSSQCSDELERLAPSYGYDTYKHALKIDEIIVLTDDRYFYEALKITNRPVPEHSCSSIALMRELYEAGKVSWAEYLQFFALLSGYRYRLLPISVDDMLHTVIRQKKGGLVSIQPSELKKLNLPLTFSKEYGVQDQQAIMIAAIFAMKIILDESIPSEIAGDIFSNLVLGVFAHRDARLWGQLLVSLCEHNIESSSLVMASSQKKFEFLKHQIARFALEYNPIIHNLPSLLKAGFSKN